MAREKSGWEDAKTLYAQFRSRLGPGLEVWKGESSRSYQTLAGMLANHAYIGQRISRVTSEFPGFRAIAGTLPQLLRKADHPVHIARRLRRWRHGESTPSFGNWILLCIALNKTAAEFVRDYVLSQVEMATEMPDIHLASLLTEDDRDVFGREGELAGMHEKWRLGLNHIVVLWGLPGFGKTALVREWLRRLRRNNYDGAKRLLGFSFRDPTGEKHAAHSTDLIEHGLKEWFHRSPTYRWAEDARHLAQLVSADRSVVILDAIDPLLERLHSGAYKLRFGDPIVEFFQQFLLQAGKCLCIVTARFHPQITSARETLTEFQLQPLGAPDGITLLRTQGLQTASDANLARVVTLLGGSPLFLIQVGSQILQIWGGSVSTWLKRRGAAWPTDHAEILVKVFSEYEASLLGSAEWEVMCILGLFDRAANEELLKLFLRADVIPGLNEHLRGSMPIRSVGWIKITLHRTLFRLGQMALADLVTGSFGQNVIETHSTVRAHFREWLQRRDSQAYEAGLRLLTDYLQEQVLQGVRRGRQYGHASVETYKVYKLFEGFARRLASPEAIFSVFWARCIRSLMQVDLKGARSTLKQMSTVARRIGGPAFKAELQCVSGHIAFHLEADLKKARACFERAVHLARSAPVTGAAPLWATDTLPGAAGPLSLVFQLLGSPGSAKAWANEAIRVARRRDRYSLINAHCYAGWTAQMAGDFYNARRHAIAARRLGKHTTHNWYAGATVLKYWADVKIHRDDRLKDRATQGMRRGIMAWEASGSSLGLPYLKYLLADALCALDEPEEALGEIQEALQLASDKNEAYLIAELQRLRGEAVLEARGDKSLGRKCFNSALIASRRVGSR